MTRNREFAPSVGQLKTPKNIRRDLNDLANVVVKSAIDLHIIRLLELHPKLEVRFRNQDLASLDQITKETLLRDLNTVLGVRPMKKRKQ